MHRLITFLILVLICSALEAKSELTTLTIPVMLEEVGTINSGFELVVEAYQLNKPISSDSMPSRIKAAVDIANSVLGSAGIGDAAEFTELCSPSLDEKSIQNHFTLFKNLVKSYPTLAFARAFSLGNQVLVTAIFPSGNEGTVTVLTEAAANDFKQNLALSFEPLPQAIAYALKENTKVIAVQDGFAVDTNLAIRLRLSGPEGKALGAPVIMNTGELYGRGIPTDETAFEKKFDHPIESLLERYFQARESIGVAKLAEKSFTKKGLSRIRSHNVAYQRPAVALRTDFVVPFSKRLFLLLICPNSGDGLTTAFVAIGPDGQTKVLNFGYSGKLDELIKLPSVKQQLLEYWKKRKEQP
jgi:hypothetical protein